MRWRWGLGHLGHLICGMTATCNCVIEPHRSRAIPPRQVTPDDALGFAVFTTIFAVMMMGLYNQLGCGGHPWLCQFFLCGDLYHVSQTPYGAKYCHRWSNKGFSTDGSLGNEPGMCLLKVFCYSRLSFSGPRHISGRSLCLPTRIINGPIFLCFLLPKV